MSTLERRQYHVTMSCDLAALRKVEIKFITFHFFDVCCITIKIKISLTGLRFFISTSDEAIGYTVRYSGRVVVTVET